jgi:hypothetical protein
MSPRRSTKREKEREVSSITLTPKPIVENYNVYKGLELMFSISLTEIRGCDL